MKEVAVGTRNKNIETEFCVTTEFLGLVYLSHQ